MLSTNEKISLAIPYIRKRMGEQLKAVSGIMIYLIGFQTLILKSPILNASTVAVGLALVVLGLALFMEGLMLGLMPLGESLGIKLPARVNLITLMLFAFAMGVGATFAEPAIGVMRAAGRDVTPWQAPLLFRLLNTDSELLVNSVSIGVGLAVCLGVLRFIYQFSLKPVLFLAVFLTLALTAFGAYDNKLAPILGLAWDCGAVTTGPVTVPLVLALGVGISRMTGGSESDTNGFGIVTLASIFPIMCVLILALALSSNTPSSMSYSHFLEPDRQAELMPIFKNEAHYQQYVKDNADIDNQNDYESPSVLLLGSFEAAVRAILPLCGGMLIVLLIFLKEKLLYSDEVILGIILAVIGMAVFHTGIKLGLANVGRQVGQILPSAYQTIEVGPTQTISNFSSDLVLEGTNLAGERKKFFFLKDGSKTSSIPFKSDRFDKQSNSYQHRHTLGPLFGTDKSKTGIFVILIFAFIMGYGATLAEPALNALGSTVETITAGSLRKRLLMHSVALGVGLGLTLGVSKIVWDIPIAPMLIIPYTMLLILTYISSETFVNIAWDSAGVTTGPITVPLVIALGLGIGSQSNTIEGFGILAMASVCPILVVLSVGVWLEHKRSSNAPDSINQPVKTQESNHNYTEDKLKKSA